MHVYSSAENQAFMSLSMAPGSLAKLEETVKANRNIDDTSIPVCAVKLAKGGGGAT